MIQITDHKNLQSTAYESDRWKTFQTRLSSTARRRQIVKLQMFRRVRFTFRSVHTFSTVIGLQQAHRLRRCLRTSCKRYLRQYNYRRDFQHQYGQTTKWRCLESEHPKKKFRRVMFTWKQTRKLIMILGTVNSTIT